MYTKNLRDEATLDQYLFSKALTIRVMLGGEHPQLFRSSSFLSETMLIGMDTIEPSNALGPDAPSIAAVVANHENSCSYFPASFRFHEKGAAVNMFLTYLCISLLAHGKSTTD